MADGTIAAGKKKGEGTGRKAKRKGLDRIDDEGQTRDGRRMKWRKWKGNTGTGIYDVNENGQIYRGIRERQKEDEVGSSYFCYLFVFATLNSLCACVNWLFWWCAMGFDPRKKSSCEPMSMRGDLRDFQLNLRIFQRHGINKRDTISTYLGKKKKITILWRQVTTCWIFWPLRFLDCWRWPEM